MIIEIQLKNIWTKIYLNGNMWARNSHGTILIATGDMFVDKDHWRKVIRDYTSQEGIVLQTLRNDKFKHIATCKGESCMWRIHCS